MDAKDLKLIRALLSALLSLLSKLIPKKFIFSYFFILPFFLFVTSYFFGGPSNDIPVDSFINPEILEDASSSLDVEEDSKTDFEKIIKKEGLQYQKDAIEIIPIMALTFGVGLAVYYFYK